MAREYSVLVKARVTTLIMLTAWCGAYLAALKSGLPALSWTTFHALLGIGLVSGGTAAINEVMERDLDARMRRTSMRPLVTRDDERRACVAGRVRHDHRRNRLSVANH